MNIIDDPFNPLTPASKYLAKQMLTALGKHYGSVKDGWTVMIVEGHGVAQVTNNFLSGKMGFVLHITQIDSEMKAVVKAGGELLERYNVLRHPQLSINAALKNTKFNNKGQMIHEN